MNDLIAKAIAASITRSIRVPKNFRQFWGAVLDQNIDLRSIRESQKVELRRSDLKRMMKLAFEAGREAMRRERPKNR